MTFSDRMPFVAVLGQLLQRGANADGESQGEYVGFWQVVILFLKNFIGQVPTIAFFHVWVKSGGHVAQVANLVRDGLGEHGLAEAGHWLLVKPELPPAV